MKCIICDYEFMGKDRSVCDLCLMKEALLSTHQADTYTFPDGRLSITTGGIANLPSSIEEESQIRWLNEFNRGGKK